MAVLSDAQRAELHAEHMRELSINFESLAITKTELRAAVDALDDWLNDNAAAVNNALPAAAKAGLTTQQKARLLMYVVRQRYLGGA